MKSRCVRIVVVCAVLLVGASGARAGEVTVTLEPGDAADYAAELGIDVAELERRLTAEIEDLFNVADSAEYLRALADAHAMANAGLGADYASNPTNFVLGVAGAVAVAVGDEGIDERDEERPVGSPGVSVAIVGGLNMGRFGMKELTLYGNVFSRSGTLDDFDATYRNFGVHAQYKVFRPDGAGEDKTELVLQWGGFDVTTGLSYSHLGLSLEMGAIETDLVADDATGQTVQLSSRGQYDLSSTALTVPVEVTSNLRAFYFVTLYGGVGLDFQLGASDLELSLDGTMTADDPQGGAPLDIGDANIAVTDDAGPSPGKLRFMFGGQINVWMVKLFFQGNLRPDRALAFAFGTRVAL